MSVLSTKSRDCPDAKLQEQLQFHMFPQSRHGLQADIDFIDL